MSRAATCLTAITLLSGCGARTGLDGAIVAVPRPVAPLSTATVTSQQPTFRWQPAPGTKTTFVEICRDRACTERWSAMEVSGAEATPPTPLPSGVLFWRLAGRAYDGTRGDFGPTWQLQVGARSAPVDSSWGTVADLNGDGRADVVVGAPSAIGEHVGQAYVYLSGGGGLPPEPSATLSRAGGGQTELGWRVASAGDVDGDGFADLLVSAPSRGAQRCDRGRSLRPREVALHLGGPLGPSTNADATLTGPTDPAIGLGWSVSSAGDVNGDGYADVIVAGECVAPSCDHGVAFLYLGGPTGLSAEPAAALSPPDGPRWPPWPMPAT